jgi:hypothetical protein
VAIAVGLLLGMPMELASLLLSIATLLLVTSLITDQHQRMKALSDICDRLGPKA